MGCQVGVETSKLTTVMKDGSSGVLVRHFGAEGEFAVAEESAVPAVFKVPESPR